MATTACTNRTTCQHEQSSYVCSVKCRRASTIASLASTPACLLVTTTTTDLQSTQCHRLEGFAARAGCIPEECDAKPPHLSCRLRKDRLVARGHREERLVLHMLEPDSLFDCDSLSFTRRCKATTDAGNCLSGYASLSEQQAEPYSARLAFGLSR